MNAETLKNAGIDYDFGVKRFVGRAYLYEKALCKFAKDGTFSRIRAAYEANDREGLLSAAHEFKGMCGNIGLTALYQAADALVQLLRKGADAASARAAYHSLETDYQRVYSAVVAAMEETV